MAHFNSTELATCGRGRQGTCSGGAGVTGAVSAFSCCQTDITPCVLTPFCGYLTWEFAAKLDLVSPSCLCSLSLMEQTRGIMPFAVSITYYFAGTKLLLCLSLRLQIAFEDQEREREGFCPWTEQPLHSQPTLKRHGC